MLKAILHRLYQKKTLIASFLFLLLFLFTIQTHAQNPWYSPSKTEHEAALQECLDGNVGLECTVQAIVSAIKNSLTETVAPSSSTYPPNGSVGAQNINKSSPIYVVTRMITTIIGNPPISTGRYVEYVAQKINPVDQAYAQGSTGFRALSSLIKIWTAFRNIAYLAFVVIFIFIGFMIMFRARLDPQTVVNIQNSLPKLVITLILITFSYAIAAFMVDLIYLGIFLSISVLASQGLLGDQIAIRQSLLESNVFQLAFQAGFIDYASSVADAVHKIIQPIIEESFIAGAISFLAFDTGIASLIVAVAILFSLFKLFFQLLMAYINIILQTMLSPIMLLFNALPGSQSFSGWVRNFLSNVLIFPAVALFFLISAILMGPAPGEPDIWGVEESLFDEGERWSPPFVAIYSEAEDYMALISLGFILFMPQMVTVLQQALKAKPLPTAGVFAPIAAGAGIVTGAATAPFRGIGRAVGGGARIFVGEKVERMARRGEGGTGGRVG